MSNENKGGPAAIQLAKATEEKEPEDSNVATGSLDAVQNAADSSDAEGEVEVNIPTPPDMVKVKNIAKVNIFHSAGKIKAGCEGFCSEEDADALQNKELAIKI